MAGNNSFHRVATSPDQDYTPTMNSLSIFPALLGVALLVRNANATATNSDLNVARQLNDAFVAVTERVIPSVVVITVHQRPPDVSDAENDTDSSRRRFQRRRVAPAFY